MSQSQREGEKEKKIDGQAHFTRSRGHGQWLKWESNLACRFFDLCRSFSLFPFPFSEAEGIRVLVTHGVRKGTPSPPSYDALLMDRFLTPCPPLRLNVIVCLDATSSATICKVVCLPSGLSQSSKAPLSPHQSHDLFFCFV